MRTTLEVVSAVAVGGFLSSVEAAVVPRANDGLARTPMMGLVFFVPHSSLRFCMFSQLWDNNNKFLVGIHTTSTAALQQKESYTQMHKDLLIQDLLVLDSNMSLQTVVGRLSSEQRKVRLPGTPTCFLRAFLHLDSSCTTEDWSLVFMLILDYVNGPFSYIQQSDIWTMITNQ